MLATQFQDADIRPISDLRNKFAEVADYVQGGKMVIFTRNGYGSMVTMSFDSFKRMTAPAAANPVVAELNRVDSLCEADPRHYTGEESMALLKERIRERRARVRA